MSDVKFTTRRCPSCAEPFRLPEDAAGKRARCRACNGTFVVISDDSPIDESHDNASTVIRHQPTERDFELAFGDEESIEAVSSHIERYIGPIENVFHEIFSDLIHVDIYCVAPSTDRPFHTLVTSGMSDLEMSAPPGAEEFGFAELVVFLPAHWRVSTSDFKDEQWYWPLRWMKILSRFPHECKTWLWDGHTVPNGDPPEPFAPNTKLCGMMLVKPLSAPPEFARLTVGDKTIHFFALVPLYAEEMNHKIKYGMETLFPRFEKHGVTDLIDVNRPNVCKKRFGIF